MNAIWGFLLALFLALAGEYLAGVIAPALGLQKGAISGIMMAILLGILVNNLFKLPEVPSKRQMALSVVLAARPRLLRAPLAVVAPVPPLLMGCVLMPGEKPGEMDMAGEGKSGKSEKQKLEQRPAGRINGSRGRRRRRR